MPLLVKESREATTIKGKQIMSNEHVGGIKMVYKIVQPGITLPILRTRIMDKKIGEIVFFKPLRKHLNEKELTPHAKTKNLMSNTWIVLNNDFKDIALSIRHLRVKGIVVSDLLIKALNNNISEIYMSEEQVKSYSYLS